MDRTFHYCRCAFWTPCFDCGLFGVLLRAELAGLTTLVSKETLVQMMKLLAVNATVEPMDAPSIRSNYFDFEWLQPEV